jgi:esterase/lipase superfamily enzyme
LSETGVSDFGLSARGAAVAHDLNPAPLLANVNGRSVLKVFYATDRQVGTPTAKGISYGPDENNTATLDYGVTFVSIPPNHKPGQIETPSIFKLEFTEDPAKHIVIQSVTREAKDDFFADLHSTVASTPKKEALIFIHGFNVSFAEASRRLAQLTFDLKFAGAPILYSWPSRAQVKAYTADEESVQWTALHLVDFLEDVHQRSGATTVHIIAHSMGNRALLNALEILAHEKSTIHFKEVILAAPDVARSQFVQQLPIIQSLADHLTLYASSKDQALSASKHLNYYVRAGQSTGNLTIIPPVETVDATAVSSGFLGHSYFGDNVLVLDDMQFLIRDGLPAQRREHLRPNAVPTAAYWIFVP